MKVIHIVRSIIKINFGVWNAAIFASDYLKEQHDVDSEMWICNYWENQTTLPPVDYHYFSADQKKEKGFKQWVSSFDKDETVIVTHSAWFVSTKLGYWAKQAGYKWIYIPHGMLEPWGFQHRKLLKKLYFRFYEKRMALNADVIRAVSDSEKGNLFKLFNREIQTIYNGVELDVAGYISKESDTHNYVFISRLHRKKGIYPFVKAWQKIMGKSPKNQLWIVGPDEGELEKIKPHFTDNVKYFGSVYGEEKIKILQKAHYFLLPSFSEGFPTSVVEAMNYGVIPLISIGCNFPKVFSENLGYQIEPDETSITKVLTQLRDVPFDDSKSRQNLEYVRNTLSEKIIGDQLYNLYKSLLPCQNTILEKS